MGLKGLGFGASGLGRGIHGVGLILGFRVSGFMFKVFGFRVRDLLSKCSGSFAARTVKSSGCCV